jgi:hypothetical protein
MMWHKTSNNAWAISALLNNMRKGIGVTWHKQRVQHSAQLTTTAAHLLPKHNGPP